MYHTILISAALLPFALSSPQPHGRYHGYGRHAHLHLSSAPFPIGTGGLTSTIAGTAPYGNLSSPETTGTTTTYSTVTLTETISNKVTATEAAGPTDNPQVSSVVVNKGLATASSGVCDAGTITVTISPTFTVTVISSKDSAPESASLSSVYAPSSSLVLSSFSAASSEVETPTSSTSELRKSTLRTVRNLAETRIAVDDTSSVPVAPSSEAAVATPVKTSLEAATSTTKKSDSSTADVPASTAPASKGTSSAPAPITTVAAAPSSSSSAVKATTSAPAKSSSGNKRGILASGPDQDALVSAFNSASKIKWLGNWFSNPPGHVDSHIEFVPQNYGKQSDIAPDYEWTANAKKQVADGAKYFMSFGEPEFLTNKQLYMTPQEAVDLWMQKMQPYADKVTIGAPAVLQPTTDMQWLSDFLTGCDKAGCSIGFICIHWFWKAEDDLIKWFKETVTNATVIANGKPVWVDNFQAVGSNAAQQEFLNGVLPWLEENPAIERYAYVSPDRSTGTGFLNADGSISDLGKFYADF